ncbi:MAG: FecR domain-containing protein [Verrucomicrobiales bacterium]|nr:FecR domain-containing protein [Verrucomicrobiales bacterium]
MKSSKFSQLPKDEQDWIDAYLDGTISDGDFDQLQDRMMESPELREAMRSYLSLDHSLLQLSDAIVPETESATGPWLQTESAPSEKIARFPKSFIPIAAAATIAFLTGSALMYWNQRNGEIADTAKETPSANGFAVIQNLFDPSWEKPANIRREGDMLGAEVFTLASGTAQIQFFSGAIMTVEGPSQIELKSAWEASCREGAVRMKVPPAARGFKLQTPSSEIIDLGTEFGLVVRDGTGHVEVIDGEISVRHRGEEEKILKQSDALNLDPNSAATVSQSGQVTFPDLSRFGSRSAEELTSSFQRWERHRDVTAQDPRVLAYYTFDGPNHTIVPNLSEPRKPDFDGTVILAEPVSGRWPGMKSALEFRRPGARVRVNIPGTFSAFTFACWTRIDSLDRRYNALFMGDGYERGEPHWQIRDDGKMMLSVMVDESQPNPRSTDPQSRLHKVYFSPPMWDMSMSGQWLHLASVFDPASRTVSHYVNGEKVSSQEIESLFFVDQLRIGNGEIGNWGEPFRKDPNFAIRHLNGRLDEFTIYQSALTDNEIANLYHRSRSDLK